MPVVSGIRNILPPLLRYISGKTSCNSAMQPNVNVKEHNVRLDCISLALGWAGQRHENVADGGELTATWTIG